jgi:hypothetical protein
MGKAWEDILAGTEVRTVKGKAWEDILAGIEVRTSVV